MKYIIWFGDLTKDDTDVAGKKGANLGELYRTGLPIPPGYVVTINAYFDYLKANKIDKKIKDILKGVDLYNQKEVEQASEKIKKMIENGKIPNTIEQDVLSAYKTLKGRDKNFNVAIRGSTSNEYEDKMEKTYLNIQGKNEVLKAIKKIWAALFEPEEIIMREEKGYKHTKTGISIVIQKMIMAEKSGLIFTQSQEGKNEMIIKAVYGLGEAIINGEIEPDVYIVDKEKLDILDKKVVDQKFMVVKIKNSTLHTNVREDRRGKQKISNKTIIELARYAKKIETNYKKPLQIEWVIERDKTYIINTEEYKVEKTDKKIIKNEAKSVKDAKVILRGTASNPGIATGKVKIIKNKEDVSKVSLGDIIVLTKTSQEYLQAIKRAAAIITEENEPTAYAVIISRELGIPCIINVKGATKKIKENSIITVDAREGVIYEGSINVNIKGDIIKETIPTGTKIYVNIIDPKTAETIAKKDVDGVGLLRGDIILSNLGIHPRKIVEEDKEDEFVDQITEEIRKVAAAFYPRPVIYRITDLKTNEYRRLNGGESYEPKEENPLLGYRGSLRQIREPEVFKLELRAIKKVRDKYKLKNLWIMMPFLRDVKELIYINDILKEVGLSRNKDFKLWVTAEVPSIAVMIDEIVKHVDGISIGINDLTQLILGIDKDNIMVAREYDERNEAVIKTIKIIIEGASNAGIETSICGQATAIYPEFTERIIEYGITSITTNPESIEITRRHTAEAERKILLKMYRKINKN